MERKRAQDAANSEPLGRGALLARKARAATSGSTSAAGTGRLAGETRRLRSPREVVPSGSLSARAARAGADGSDTIRSSKDRRGDSLRQSADSWRGGAATASGSLRSTPGQSDRDRFHGEAAEGGTRGQRRRLPTDAEGVGGVSATPRGSTSRRTSDGSSSLACAIRVVVRLRPHLPKEGVSDDCITVHHDRQTLLVEDGESRRQVTVDDVIDSRDDAADPTAGTQEAVFSRVGRDLVESALNDYNVCIFAYGHTGTGKTHTMIGHGDLRGTQAGLQPRFIQELFAGHGRLAQTSTEGPRYNCSYCEVYNETINDLLAPTHVQGADRKRNVHVHPRHGVRVDGLSMSVISSAEECLELIHFGNQMRTVACTTMNEKSSRSHAVFTFQLERDDKEHHVSTVTFVDLAGREDQAVTKNKADTFREMCYINTSLFHLAHVITKLSQHTVHEGSLADFRNSKLTLLLSCALMGNSRTALIATVAPARTYHDDSMSTLNFAQQVKHIKTKPVVNNKMSKAVVAELEAELARLRDELTMAKTSNKEVELELQAAQNMIEKYSSTWSDLQASSAAARQTRKRVTTMLGLQPQRGISGGTGCSSEAELPPFLTKLSDDPSLQGCCNFFLAKAVLRVGSLEHMCDIVLRGVGIKPAMCEIRYRGSEVFVELMCAQGFEEGDESCSESSSSFAGSEEWQNRSSKPLVDYPRVLVNGRRLRADQGPQALEHGDCLIIGYAHAFRLCLPHGGGAGGAVIGDAQTVARDTLQSLDVATAMAEVTADESSERFAEVYRFLQHLQQLGGRPAEASAQDTIQMLSSLCPLIDEANTITTEVFGERRMSLRLRAVTDILDLAHSSLQLVVVLLRHDRPSAASDTSAKVPAGASKRGSVAAAAATMLGGRRGSLLPRCSVVHMEKLGVLDSIVGGAAEEQLVYVWSLEKFLHRLDEMREVYQNGSEANDGFASVRERLQEQPYLNPWREMAFVDTKRLAAESAAAAAAAAAAGGCGAGAPEATHGPAASLPDPESREAERGAASAVAVGALPLAASAAASATADQGADAEDPPPSVADAASAPMSARSTLSVARGGARPAVPSAAPAEACKTSGPTASAKALASKIAMVISEAATATPTSMRESPAPPTEVAGEINSIRSELNALRFTNELGVNSLARLIERLETVVTDLPTASPVSKSSALPSPPSPLLLGGSPMMPPGSPRGSFGTAASWNTTQVTRLPVRISRAARSALAERDAATNASACASAGHSRAPSPPPGPGFASPVNSGALSPAVPAAIASLAYVTYGAPVPVEYGQSRRGSPTRSPSRAAAFSPTPLTSSAGIPGPQRPGAATPPSPGLMCSFGAPAGEPPPGATALLAVPSLAGSSRGGSLRGGILSPRTLSPVRARQGGAVKLNGFFMS
eukprot:TRINITY_DN2206_c0_g2_i1.p1 TRINITY_DN2206_c0_g2~~TRINITY_DN2206_c0_g2_i1.p1  ORF type:complete len:1403 (+),score=270.12 TRINITY_DN2206_c0_g2_i1:105-4313(+)